MDISLEHLTHDGPSVSETVHEQQTSEIQPDKMSEIPESSSPITHIENSTDESGENEETEKNETNESKSKDKSSTSAPTGNAAPIERRDDTLVLRGGSTPIASENGSSDRSCGADCADCCEASCICLCLSVAFCYDLFWAIVCCPIWMPILCCHLFCCSDSD
jgi:hypothetical protein